MRPLDPAVQPPHPEFDVHRTENVPVPMRDGVRLATDVYRPARDGRPLADRHPVLLHRRPYNKTENGDHAGPVPLVRRARLGGGQPGLPRPLRLGG